MSDEPVEAETAFLIVKRLDGSFYATINLEQSLTLHKNASNRDIRLGCRDISDLLSQHEFAQVIVDKLQPKSDSERATSSIRQALEDKGIL